MPLVTYFRNESVGLITIDHPPVNAISSAVIQDFTAALERFEGDVGANSLLITCEGRTFVAGADIGEFDKRNFSAAPYNQLLARIESLSRPVVATLHGTVLGAGLELAMACHFRVAHRSTRLALPEVKLGLLPGSLGTQRLPRLVGATEALNLITSGQMVTAERALDIGLIDTLSDDPAIKAGIRRAQDIVSQGIRIRRTRDLPVAPAPDGILSAASDAATHKPAYPASAAIVRCIQVATHQPFEEGEAVEAREFEALLSSPTSKSLRHLFFAQREAMKIPGLARDTPLRVIRKVGVVGAGTMGGGIAMNFANAGIATVLVEAKQEALDRGLGIIRKNYETSAAKGRLTAQQVEERMNLLRGSLNYADLTDCDLVIEAVFEDLQLKREICARLGSIVKPGGILATNTSTLDVDHLAEASGRPADFVGMHFFSPANVMRLLEVVRGQSTSPDVLSTVMKLGQTIGKVPVVSGVCFGFIGNRMAEVYLREAEFLLMEGAEPQQIDSAAEALGLAMGPCRMLDLAGLDVGAKVVLERGKAGGLPPDPSYRAVVRHMYEVGRHGQKSSEGYYRYEGRLAIPDPEVTGITQSLAETHRIARRSNITRQEIIERLFYTLINEGMNILEEGIAYRPGDIDIVWTCGYGFPDHLGGPMYMADNIGLPIIAQRLALYENQRGNLFGYWTPSPLLIRLVESGIPLKNWKKETV